MASAPSPKSDQMIITVSPGYLSKNVASHRESLKLTIRLCRTWRKNDCFS